MNLNWKYCDFDALSQSELYGILRLRSQVFVVEQNCVYQDLDGYDECAFHLFTMENEECIAYARLFLPDLKYSKSASIGRVVVADNFRHLGLGSVLMEKAIRILSDFKEVKNIRISAQAHLENFYNSFGFQTSGDSYLEDGISHLEMNLEV